MHLHLPRLCPSMELAATAAARGRCHWLKFAPAESSSRMLDRPADPSEDRSEDLLVSGSRNIRTPLRTHQPFGCPCHCVHRIDQTPPRHHCLFAHWSPLAAAATPVLSPLTPSRRSPRLRLQTRLHVCWTRPSGAHRMHSRAPRRLHGR